MSVAIFKWFDAPEYEFRWIGPDGSTLADAQRNPTAVAAVVGPPGPPSPISTDADNRAEIGTDGRLYVGPPIYETAQW